MASCAVYNNITSASSWTPIIQLYNHCMWFWNRLILLESKKKLTRFKVDLFTFITSEFISSRQIIHSDPDLNIKTLQVTRRTWREQMESLYQFKASVGAWRMGEDSSFITEQREERIRAIQTEHQEIRKLKGVRGKFKHVTLIGHKDRRLEEWQTDAAALRRPVNHLSVSVWIWKCVHKETAFRPASTHHYVLSYDLNHVWDNHEHDSYILYKFKLNLFIFYKRIHFRYFSITSSIEGIVFNIL